MSKKLGIMLLSVMILFMTGCKKDNQNSNMHLNPLGNVTFDQNNNNNEGPFDNIHIYYPIIMSAGYTSLLRFKILDIYDDVYLDENREEKVTVATVYLYEEFDEALGDPVFFNQYGNFYVDQEKFKDKSCPIYYYKKLIIPDGYRDFFTKYDEYILRMDLFKSEIFYCMDKLIDKNGTYMIKLSELVEGTILPVKDGRIYLDELTEEEKSLQCDGPSLFYFNQFLEEDKHLKNHDTVDEFREWLKCIRPAVKKYQEEHEQSLLK